MGEKLYVLSTDRVRNFLGQGYLGLLVELSTRKLASLALSRTISHLVFLSSRLLGKAEWCLLLNVSRIRLIWLAMSDTLCMKRAALVACSALNSQVLINYLTDATEIFPVANPSSFYYNHSVSFQ